MNCEFIQELILLSFEETLTILQQKLVFDHTSHCTECSQAKSDLTLLEEELVGSFSSFALSEESSETLFAQIEFQIATKNQPHFFWKYSLAAAALLISGVVFMSVASFCFESNILTPDGYQLKDIEAVTRKEEPPQEELNSLKKQPSSLVLKEIKSPYLEAISLKQPEMVVEKELIVKPKYPNSITQNNAIVESLKPFRRMKTVWVPTRLRGEVLSISENREFITLNKGKEDYLFEGNKVTLHQKDFRATLIVAHAGEHQAMCRLTNRKHPIRPGGFFFTTVKVPTETFIKNVYVQGEISFIQNKQIVIDPITNLFDLEIGDLLSVYRGTQKIGIVFMAEDPKYQVAQVIFQASSFQRGDQVVLEHQPKNYLGKSY